VLFDVSSVTDALLSLVSSAWSTAPLWQELGTGVSFQPTFSGLAPDAIRTQAGAQLSMYLYHVEQDPAREAQFWTAAAQSVPNHPPISFQPMALDLFYLLTAYSQNSYIQEQQAMSIALRIFHANPIVRGGTGGQAWELTLTMEHRSYDELSRLWQATTAPIRLGAVYRAAVMFLQPDAGPAAAAVPTTVGLSTGPGVPPAAPPVAPPGPPVTVQVTDTGLPAGGST
jgi:Pvc16 N-terminal domain